MPKKFKKIEDHLETIENLIAGLLLKSGYTVKTVSKVLGVSDTKLTEMYPQNKKKKEVINQVNNDG